MYGTLFQSTASATEVTNTQTLTPTSNGVSVSMTFSNVVPANNDWILFDFVAQASDGSQYDLGDLATLIDITSSGTNLVNLDTNSTLRFQAMITSLGNGISSYDLENNAALDSSLASYLTSHPQYTPDPNTGLFSATTAQSIANDLQTTYGRTLTLTTSGGTGSSAIYSITYDYTSTAENNLDLNACPFDFSSGCANGIFHGSSNAVSGNLAAGVSTPYFIYGVPLGSGSACGNQVVSANPGATANAQCASAESPIHTPGSGASTAYPVVVSAALINGGGNSSITVPVYGGGIIVGAHDRAVINNLVTLPMHGGTVTIAGLPPGASSQNIAQTSTALTVSAVDPQTQALDASGAQWDTSGLFGGSDGYGSFFLSNDTLGVLGFGTTVPTGGYTAYPTTPAPTFPAIYPQGYSVAVSLSPETGSITYGVPEVYAGYTYSLAAEPAGSGTWSTVAGPVSASGTQFNTGTVTFPSVTIPASTNEALALFVTVNNSSTPFTPVFGYVLQPNYLTSAGTVNFYTYCPGPTNGDGACDFAEYATPPTTTTYGFSPPNSVPGTVPVFGGPTISLTLDTWNPFGLTNAQLDMCSVSSCTPLNTGGTINATSTFFDNGSNLSYYNWAGSGSDITTGVSTHVGGGYSVAYTPSGGGGGTGSFSSATPALFGPQATFKINTSAPSGTAWSLTITDTNGHAYTAVRTNANGSSNTPEFFFPSIVSPITAQNITFTYTLSSGITTPGSFTVYYL